MAKKRLNDVLPSEWDRVAHEPIDDNEWLDEIRQDKINPNHYKQGNIECIDYILETVGKKGFSGYCQGNVIKYLHRWRLKNGLEDLKKAQWYLNRMVQEEEKDEG